MRGTGAGRTGAADGAPAQRLAMWMGVGLLGRIAGEHVIDELKQALEALRC